MFAIRAIFFDLGDTLDHISPAKLDEICTNIGIRRGKQLTNNEYMRSFKTEMENHSTPKNVAESEDFSSDPKLSEYEFWKIFFEGLLPTLGLASPDMAFINWLIDIYSNPNSFVCFDDVHDVLTTLKNRGYTLGLISNAHPSADKILDNLNLRQYFKYIFLSFELPYAKPESRIYQFAAEKTNIPIDNTLFIDDRWVFVKGAQEAKMNALLIDRDTDLHCKPQTKSLVHRIKSLKELLNLVELSNKTNQMSQGQEVSGENDASFCALRINQSAISISLKEDKQSCQERNKNTSASFWDRQVMLTQKEGLLIR